MRRLQFLQQTAVSILAASNLLSCKELASVVLSGKAVCGLTESDQQGPFYVQQTAQQPNLNLANLPGIMMLVSVQCMMLRHGALLKTLQLKFGMPTVSGNTILPPPVW